MEASVANDVPLAFFALRVLHCRAPVPSVCHICISNHEEKEAQVKCTQSSLQAPSFILQLPRLLLPRH